MALLDLVNGLETLKQEYKKQMNDLPRSYVRGSVVYEEAEKQVKANYQNQKSAFKMSVWVGIYPTYPYWQIRGLCA
ncbi:hypothetical protein PNV01_13435 [Turicibacter sanguinis]|uniref:hypothetical protein n=1 Tax=Turicibacter sanguinis TaxID=154288 RepID=UPI00232C6AB4|nr:hypothetical protein [Turicibacter sanguinis]MDB8545806.1 hypothetical protein [Turicibacter sanguinis]